MEKCVSLEYEFDEENHQIRINGSVLNLERFANDLAVALNYWVWNGDSYDKENRGSIFNSATIGAMRNYESSRIDERQMRESEGFEPDKTLGVLHRLRFGIDTVNRNSFTLHYVADFDRRENVDAEVLERWRERDWRSVKYYFHKVMGIKFEADVVVEAGTGVDNSPLEDGT